MIKEKIPTICLDLDECLVNSVFALSEKSTNFAKDYYGIHWEYITLNLGAEEKYVTFLRSWSKDLVKFSKNLVGEDNVFILSTGMVDYVKEINQRLDLGVLDTNIYGREDIKKHGGEEYGHDMFMNRNNILLDNENYSYHNCGSHTKVNFLHNLPRNKFLEVPDFEVSYVIPADDKSYFEVLKDLMVRALAE